MTRPQKGYLAAVVGCLVGGIALFVAGFVLGILYVDRFMPNAELEGILPPFLGGTGGAAVGMGLGAALGLRIRGYAGAGSTGLVTAVLGPIFVLGAVYVSEVVADDMYEPGMSEWVVPLAGAVAAGLSALLSRAVVVRFRALDPNATKG